MLHVRRGMLTEYRFLLAVQCSASTDQLLRVALKGIGESSNFDISDGPPSCFNFVDVLGNWNPSTFRLLGYSSANRFKSKPEFYSGLLDVRADHIFGSAGR
jgi:hypothetical protein